MTCVTLPGATQPKAAITTQPRSHSTKRQPTPLQRVDALLALVRPAAILGVRHHDCLVAQAAKMAQNYLAWANIGGSLAPKPVIVSCPKACRPPRA